MSFQATTRSSAAPARSSGCIPRAPRWRPTRATMLDLIGVSAGWSCLDVGCGPGGITGLLSERVGPSGRVVGLDRDAEFLAHARGRAAANTEFRQGDAYGSDLPAASFDLVHMRFVASTAGDPERLLREAIRLARPGGMVALQEPDGSTLNCYPEHPAWDRLKAALLGAFSGVGADLTLARRLYSVVRQTGLQDVQYRPFLHRRAVDRSDGRLSAVDGGIAARHRAQARADDRSRIPAGACRLPGASARAGHVVHDVHGRAGLGPHAGVASLSSSCAGLTRASIFLRKSLDCRVKPGNDGLRD